MNRQEQPPNPGNTDASTTSDVVSQPPRWRAWPVLGIALAAVVILVSVGVVWHPWQQKPAQKSDTPVSINLANENIYCPVNAAWSPDGHSVAVLAQDKQCVDSENKASSDISKYQVAIFDARGTLTKRIDLSAGIPHYMEHGTPTTTGSSATLMTTRFRWIVWLPDGRHLALPFVLLRAPGNTDYSNEGTSGMAVIPVDGSQADIAISSGPFSVGYWDFQAKRAIRLNLSDYPDRLPPLASLAYQWTSEGKVVIAHAPSPTDPVGNPSGGQSFTVWQPGTIMLDRQTSAIGFTSTFLPLSPDGRYLMLIGGFGAILDSGVDLGSSDPSRIAPRDAGLKAASERLKDPTDPYAQNMSVAWRFDGKRIAAVDPNPLVDQVRANFSQDIPKTSESVTIFDCTTGDKLLMLKTQTLVNRPSYPLNISTPMLGWNRKGNALFLLDTNFDALSIWNIPLT